MSLDLSTDLDLERVVTDLERLTDSERDVVDAWWRAANYLTVGQIYLGANPLLRTPLEVADIKPRLLGHWGTSPGLSFIYAHMSRLIRHTGQEVVYLAGPGHGGPALSLRAGSRAATARSTPLSPKTPRACAGCSASSPRPAAFRRTSRSRRPARSTRAVSWATCWCTRSAPSWTTPTCWRSPSSVTARQRPVRWRAHGRASASSTRPVTVPCCPYSTSTEPRSPARPCSAARTRTRYGSCSPATATTCSRSPGEDLPGMHDRFAAVLAQAWGEIRAIQLSARSGDWDGSRPHWPLIVLRSPKGWTGPDKVDGVQMVGTFRAHQVPLSGVRENPEHLAILESWLRSYRPEELFDADGKPSELVLASNPVGDLRMSASPHANGGCSHRTSTCPTSGRTRSTCRCPR